MPRDKSFSIGRTSLQDRGEVIPEGELGYSRREILQVGPGSYSHKDDILRLRHPSNSIGRAERVMHEKRYGPGPADYEPNKIGHLHRISSVKFNKSTFLERDERLDVPGPGQYDGS